MANDDDATIDGALLELIRPGETLSVRVWRARWPEDETGFMTAALERLVRAGKLERVGDEITRPIDPERVLGDIARIVFTEAGNETEALNRIRKILGGPEDSMKPSTKPRTGVWDDEEKKVLAVEHLFVELLDECVPAGELWRIVQNVRQSVKEETPIHSQSTAIRALVGELTMVLLGEGPRRDEPSNELVCRECMAEPGQHYGWCETLSRAEPKTGPSSGALPADVSIDAALGVRFDTAKGYWGSLGPNRAVALAKKILATWPEER